ncbi:MULTISPECIES: hypothetical protein [unclassified Novosphingobium]|uniref:hypothetical protein n=1 Tax=unclassified Novosphingobium TaxID=2644732 RepID=UPI001AD00CF0|nr:MULTISPECIES: hypothetical protein [unclassified Novosphingobium]MBN9144391.1 hypothetical protein [Novosphingobium sp.]MDR6707715.1 hypothetical protein [Novosphingobium sp. 1748]
MRHLDGVVNSRARQDEWTQPLMSVLGVGALISLTFVSARPSWPDPAQISVRRDYPPMHFDYRGEDGFTFGSNPIRDAAHVGWAI